ncbi:MAG: PPC domain-containing DNA-binding protein [Candidatus Bathyarchaeia archaeon]|jgi:predicted DNA-binding protein with PD1-like motif
MLNGKVGRIVFSRLLEDEDLAESVKRQAEMNGIRAGFFIVIGTVKHAVLGYYKEGKYETIRLEGPLEIASCTGNVAVDEEGEVVIHAHVVVSNEKGEAFGGHLMKDSHVGATAELVIVEVAGMEVQRVFDEKTKLKLWKLS